MKAKNCGPFLRGKRGRYYCWIEGRLLSLKTDKPRVAEGVYRQKLMDLEQEKQDRRERKGPRPLTVRECFDVYLEDAGDFDANSIRNRCQVFDSFCKKVGDLPYSELTTDHLMEWMTAKTNWASSTKRTKINIIMAALNYCARRKKIAANPLHGVVKPRDERRKHVMSPEDQARLLGASKGPFREILFALIETGARPGELCKARVEHYCLGMIILTEHKEDDHCEERVIYLTEALEVEIKRLIGSRTKGPIWRNAYGRPWIPGTLHSRFKRLRVKLDLGEGVFPYSTRHRFASDAINNSDANPAMLAKLLGHADTKILMKHYFRENHEAALRALEQIRRAKDKGDNPGKS